jgi:hypothetical protein
MSGSSQDGTCYSRYIDSAVGTKLWGIQSQDAAGKEGADTPQAQLGRLAGPQVGQMAETGAYLWC